MAAAAAKDNKRLIADPTISVKDLEKVLEDYMASTKTRKLRLLLSRAMQGHGGNSHGKYGKLFYVTSLCKDFAILAPR